MDKIILIGFSANPGLNENYYRICRHFDMVLPSSKNITEKILAIEEQLKDTGSIIINLNRKEEEIGMDEALFVQFAYTNNTTIFGIGGYRDTCFEGYLTFVFPNLFGLDSVLSSIYSEMLEVR